MHVQYAVNHIDREDDELKNWNSEKRGKCHFGPCFSNELNQESNKANSNPENRGEDKRKIFLFSVQYFLGGH